MQQFGLVLLGGLCAFAGNAIAAWRTQRRSFDHRLRLEKEYQIYCDLWGKLLDMRLTAGLFARSVGQADDSGWQEFRVAFNEYKDLLRKHEPFVYVDIYEPARQIEKLGREIAHQTQCIARLAAEGERRKLGPTKDEVIADRLVQAKHEREAAAEQIEPLFDQVKQAMRKRIMLRS